MQSKYMSFTLQEFTLENCDPTASIFILGVRRRIGKTTLIERLIKKCGFPIVFGCGEWEKQRCPFDYTNIVQDPTKNPFVYTDITQFSELVDRIKQWSVRASRQQVELPLVIDDMIHEPDGIMSEEPAVDPLERWENRAVVQDVLRNCRHWRTSFILASRYMLIQKPRNRQQLDYIFIFAGGIRHNKKRLQVVYKYYLEGCGIISQEVFEDYMEVLNDHQALVVDYKNSQVYYY